MELYPQNVLDQLKNHWDSIDHPQDLRDHFIQTVDSEKADAARAKLSEVRLAISVGRVSIQLHQLLVADNHAHVHLFQRVSAGPGYRKPSGIRDQLEHHRLGESLVAYPRPGRRVRHVPSCTPIEGRASQATKRKLWSASTLLPTKIAPP